MKLKAIFLLAFLLSCSPKTDLPRNAPEHINRPFVLLVSIDGYRHDYTAKFQPPFLNKFIQKGICAKGIISVFPSKTFPNHYSIATGLYPDRHGIVDNSFWDTDRQEEFHLGKRNTVEDGSWYGGEPLWVAIAKEKMVTASYFFVGTEAPIQDSHPNYWFPYNSRVPNRERALQVVEWFNLPLEHRPHFVTLYFSSIDRLGHRHGPNSVEVEEEVHKLDRILERLFNRLQKIDPPINIIILSDHGMEEVGEGKTVYLSDYIDTDSSKVKIYGRGTHFNLYIRGKKRREKIYRRLKKLPFLTVYRKEEIPPSYGYRHSPRIGDLVVNVNTPYYMKKTAFPKKIPKKGGTHGYAPSASKNMEGIFYARGPQILDKGLIPSFENIHVYPFVMGILRLKIKTKIDGDGKVLSPYLKN